MADFLDLPKDPSCLPVIVKHNPIPSLCEVSALTQGQRDVADEYLRVMDITAVAVKFNLPASEVMKTLSDPVVSAYLRPRLVYLAESFEVSKQKVLARLNALLDGRSTDRNLIRAVEVAAKILGMILPPIQMVQVNNNPYAELTDDELLMRIKERIVPVPPQVQKDGPG